MKLSITGMQGMAPVVNPASLASNGAQLARNCRLGAGDIRPLPGLRHVANSSRQRQTLFRMGQTGNEAQYWLGWNSPVEVARGGMQGDPTERLYYTGDGFPKMTTLALATAGSNLPAGWRMLGISNPAGQPLASFTPPALKKDELAPKRSSRVYVVTLVSDLGEESGPSLPSNSVSVGDGETVQLSNLPGMTGGNTVIVAKRLYRSSASGYRFLAELGAGTGSYADSAPESALGEALATLDFTPPPDTMRGMTAMQNGILAGFRGNDVLFCEPYHPYAWPEKYALTTAAPVVAMAAFGQSLLVTTIECPYLITGVDSAMMSMERLDMPQACVSARSCISVGGGAVYASPDGLIYIGIGGSRLVTEGIYSKAEWQALRPTSMWCAWSDNRLFVFFDSGSRRGALVLDLAGGAGVVELDIWAACGFVDPVTDHLYLLDGDYIKALDGEGLPWLWRSKLFTTGDGLTPSAGQLIQRPTDQTQFRLFTDGQLVMDEAVTGTTPFRLPAGRAETYEIEVAGTGRVSEITIATSMTELRRA